jgi:hypothetical protein
MNQLYGEQPLGEFYNYLTTVQVSNPKNALDTTSYVIARAPWHTQKSWPTLEDLLGDRDLLPENVKKYPIEQLKRHIMYDGGRTFGTEYPEYGIVAYSGGSSYDRPVVAMTWNIGQPNEFKRFMPTPEFNKLVKRV